MFETRKDMKNYLYNRVENDKEAEQKAREAEKWARERVTAVFDELTKTHILVDKLDIMNYGKEKAMELARERQKKEKLAELEKAPKLPPKVTVEFNVNNPARSIGPFKIGSYV